MANTTEGIGKYLCAKIAERNRYEDDKMSDSKIDTIYDLEKLRYICDTTLNNYINMALSRKVCKFF